MHSIWESDQAQGGDKAANEWRECLPSTGHYTHVHRLRDICLGELEFVQLNHKQAYSQQDSAKHTHCEHEAMRAI
jgi:hypothetical protein